MVKFAYDHDIPIIIYISCGKERVVNKSIRFVASELTKVETRVSDVLTKGKGDSLGDCIKRVQSTWDQLMDDTPGYEK